MDHAPTSLVWPSCADCVAGSAGRAIRAYAYLMVQDMKGLTKNRPKNAWKLSR